jgi:hypothetical protein
MKTTVDLPEDLVRGLKLRALEDGKTLQVLAAELLRMPPPDVPSNPARRAKALPKRLPVIAARPLAPSRASGKPRSRALSAQQINDWLKQADTNLEVERHEEIARR